MTENKTFIHFYTIKIFTVNDIKNEVYKLLKLSESKKKVFVQEPLNLLSQNSKHLKYCPTVNHHIPTKWLLTEFQLFQEMWQQLSKSLVTHTALHYIGILMSASHDLHPLLVNVLKPFCFLKIQEYRIFKGNTDLAMKMLSSVVTFLPKGRALEERQ